MRASSRSGAISKRSARLMTRSVIVPFADTLSGEVIRNLRKTRAEDILKRDETSGIYTTRRFVLRSYLSISYRCERAYLGNFGGGRTARYSLYRGRMCRYGLFSVIIIVVSWSYDDPLADQARYQASSVIDNIEDREPSRHPGTSPKEVFFFL